jgi:hypothetical protein
MADEPPLRTPREWAELLGARIHDWDGFTTAAPIDQATFDRQLAGCTIDVRGYPHFVALPDLIPAEQPLSAADAADLKRRFLEKYSVGKITVLPPDPVQKRVLAVLPDDCWVFRRPVSEGSCLQLIGGSLPNGTVQWTEDMCCLPCRVRNALGDES